MSKSKSINFSFFCNSNHIFILVIFILGGASLFLYKANVSINKQYVEPWRIISNKYPGNEYKTESIPLETKQIVIAQNKVSLDTESIADKPPLIWVQGTNQIYEIIFSGENGYTGIWGNEFKAIDLDGDNKKELITEWNLNWAGSGGYKGLIVWKYENGSIKPIAGYPDDFVSDRKIQVKNIAGKVIAEYPVTDMNYLTKVIHGGKLYFGWFVYDIQNESHMGPHFWKLSIYKYQQGKFAIDKSWNKGGELTSKEKYPLANDDELYQNLYSYFRL